MKGKCKTRDAVSLFLPVFLSMLISACSGGSAGSSPDAGTIESGFTSPAAIGPLEDASGSVTRLRWNAIKDNSQIAQGMEALKLLVPSDWTVRGGFFWNAVLRGGGISRDYAVFSPDNSRGFEYYREQPYVWSQFIASQGQIGEIYLIQGAEVRPQLRALDYIAQITLQQLAYQNITVLWSQQMPDVAEAVFASIPNADPSQRLSTDAARVRITFSANGTNFEGEVHAWISYLDGIDQFGAPVTSWRPERVFLMYAPQGEFDSASVFLYPLVLSEVINPLWAQLPAIVERSRIDINNQVIQSNAELATYLQQTSAETFDIIDQSFRDANAANDRLYDSYDQYLRGVETWLDPTLGVPVELPSGFGQVWTNPASGEYLLLNDPSFDPNTTLTGNWSMLTRS